MGAINFSMTDIYGGYAGTTEMTIPDQNDKEALTDASTVQNAPVVGKALQKAGNGRMYLAIGLVLILVIIIGGKM